MKNIKNSSRVWGSMLLSGLLFFSCDDSFLEKEPQGGYVSLDQLKENAKWNPNIMLGQNYGITLMTFDYGTGGTTDHDDFGQKSVDIATDIMSGDIAMAGETYGWFGQDSRLLSSGSTKRRAAQIWRYYFQIVKSANTIFDLVGGDRVAPESGDNRIYYGQAKTLRAYAYFNLVNLYNKPYDVSKNEKSLPIYHSQLTAEDQGLSTVEKVYELIIGDLKEAIEILEDDGSGYSYERPIYSGLEIKSEVNVSVAEGLLAYAYLSIGDFDKASGLASKVAVEYPLLQLENVLTTGFNSVGSTNWIWAIDLTKDNTPALPTFWGHMDYYTYSYAWAGDYKMCDDSLYTEIPATDERKKWFLPGFLLMPVNKFYNAARNQNSPDRQWIDDEVFMRVEEMYLIAAEAYARMDGQLDNAKSIFKTFLEQRDAIVAATVDDMTKEELLDAIYFNWRVEMWGEGKGLLTLKRFKKSMTRGGNHYIFPGAEIKWDDPRLTFEIPQVEIVNNPHLNN